MKTDRKIIEKELKEQVVPYLRESGFKGSFPDFYREKDGFVSLVNFQFYSSGGSFCINISYAEPSRDNVSFRSETAVKNLKVSQTKERARLGADYLKGDNWFSFGKTSYGEYRGAPASVGEMAPNIISLFKNQAEPWWQLKCGNQKLTNAAT